MIVTQRTASLSGHTGCQCFVLSPDLLNRLVSCLFAQLFASFHQIWKDTFSFRQPGSHSAYVFESRLLRNSAVSHPYDKGSFPWGVFNLLPGMRPSKYPMLYFSFYLTLSPPRHFLTFVNISCARGNISLSVIRGWGRNIRRKCSPSPIVQFSI